MPEQDPLTDAQITTAALPPPMLLAGVRRLDFYVLQMWRPRCLAPLSSHHQDEAAFASGMASRHRKLLAAGVPTLVLSYADLLWAPHRVIARLKAFLPCGASRLRKMSAPMLKTRPIFGRAIGARVSDWPRMAEAWGCPGPEYATAGAAWRRIWPN